MESCPELRPRGARVRQLGVLPRATPDLERVAARGPAFVDFAELELPTSAGRTWLGAPHRSLAFFFLTSIHWHWNELHLHAALLGRQTCMHAYHNVSSDFSGKH